MISITVNGQCYCCVTIALFELQWKFKSFAYMLLKSYLLDSVNPRDFYNE